MIGNFAVMRIASNDPSFAVEPDYYAKAVAFDSTMAQQRRNLALGWGIETRLDPIERGKPTRLTVLLKAPDAGPLVGARVSVMARFNARANDTITANMQEIEPGEYVASLPILTPGEWEVRVDATRPDSIRTGATDHYLVSRRVTAVQSVDTAGAGLKP